MPANKDHPLYPEYIDKCKLLFEKFEKDEEAILAKYPIWRGKDHPADIEIYPLAKKRNADLKELQKEYSFLFDPPL